MVIAYLMKRRGWSLRKAYRHVTAVRHMASPHEKYFAQLQALEMAWHGVDTPSLSREEAGPSLQQIMREIRDTHAASVADEAGAGPSAEAHAGNGAGAGVGAGAGSGGGATPSDGGNGGTASGVAGAGVGGAGGRNGDASDAAAPGTGAAAEATSSGGQLPSAADFTAALLRGASK